MTSYLRYLLYLVLPAVERPTTMGIPLFCSLSTLCSLVAVVVVDYLRHFPY